MFQLYDTNSNGFISKDEMLVIIKAIYQMRGVPSSENVAERRVEKIYQEMDANNDGQLSFDEFMVLAKLDPVVLNTLSS